MTFNRIDEKTQFNIMLKKKKEIDVALKSRVPSEKGTVDFVMHKLNRERKKLNEEIAKVAFRYMPDTIA